MHPNDPKLVHLVRKYWLRGENDEEKVLESLLVNHREYQRKNLDRLHATVVVVLERLNNEDGEDSEYEREAAAQDGARNSTRSGLNASLCNSYRKRSDETTLTTADALETPTQTKNAESATDPATPQTTTSSALRKKKRRKVKRPTETPTNEDALPSSFPTSASSPRSFLVPERPSARYSDLGGIHDTITTIQQRIGYPLQHTHVYTHLGIAPPRGILLKGPPGTGKSHLANAVAGELGGTVSYYKVSAPEVVSGVSGESEQTIRSLFQAAIETAPSLIFFDELDVICPKRNDQSRGMEQRIVAQLLTCLDSLWPTPNQQCVMVLAATNRPDALDPAIRRRFATELELGVPDQEARARMIQTMTRNMRTQLSPEQIQALAQSTPGYVGADVQSLLQQAAEIAIHRIVSNSSSAMSTPAINEEGGEPAEEAMEDVEASSASAPLSTTGNDATTPSVTVTPADLQDAAVTMQDFLDALPLVQPSAQREGFATVPDVSFDAIGALADIRAELALSVLEPIRAPERFAQLGLTIPAGVLLYGPPGCGKTLLAKAIAHAAAANFISVKGPALLDKYVGESERAVRVVFERARSSSPCIVFFDELDALVPKRSSGGDGGGRVTERVVNQLLTELDGLDARKSVFIVAATNRPELIDPAMLRPGRLDKLLYVPLPTPAERVLILQTLAKNVAVDPSVDLAFLAKHPSANGYSGADCAALLREAGLAVLKEQTAAATELQTSASPLTIQTHHFERAFAAVRPSVSKQDQKRYERIRDRMASARSRAPEHAEQKERISHCD